MVGCLVNAVAVNPKKNVFVSASSSGIGLGIVRKFWDEGYTTVINGRNDERLKLAAQRLGGEDILACCADVSDPTHLKSVVEFVGNNLGELNTLVCNLGSGSGPTPGSESLIDWNKAFAINFFSAIGLISALKDFFPSHGGSIICISSICGVNCVPGAPIPYSVAKSALNHFVKCSAASFGSRNIRINAVAPGNILHAGSVWARKIRETPDSVEKMLKNDVALCLGQGG